LRARRSDSTVRAATTTPYQSRHEPTLPPYLEWKEVRPADELMMATAWHPASVHQTNPPPGLRCSALTWCHPASNAALRPGQSTTPDRAAPPMTRTRALGANQCSEASVATRTKQATCSTSTQARTASLRTACYGRVANSAISNPREVIRPEGRTGRRDLQSRWITVGIALSHDWRVFRIVVLASCARYRLVHSWGCVLPSLSATPPSLASDASGAARSWSGSTPSWVSFLASRRKPGNSAQNTAKSKIPRPQNISPKTADKAPERAATSKPTRHETKRHQRHDMPRLLDPECRTRNPAPDEFKMPGLDGTKKARMRPDCPRRMQPRRVGGRDRRTPVAVGPSLAPSTAELHQTAQSARNHGAPTARKGRRRRGAALLPQYPER
jgi:hypothetical protein